MGLNHHFITTWCSCQEHLPCNSGLSFYTNEIWFPRLAVPKKKTLLGWHMRLWPYEMFLLSGSSEPARTSVQNGKLSVSQCRECKWTHDTSHSLDLHLTFRWNMIKHLPRLIWGPSLPPWYCGHHWPGGQKDNQRRAIKAISVQLTNPKVSWHFLPLRRWRHWWG
jgi:hypothetical protein